MKSWVPSDVPLRLRRIAFCISVYLLFTHAWIWVLTTPLALAGRADFRQFYAAGAMVRAREARKLYDYKTQKEFQDHLVSPQPTALPFVSPASHALLFDPLSLTSYKYAYFAFLALNVATLAVIFVVLRKSMQNLQAIYSWLPVAMFVSFMPILMALIQGQDSILLTALMAGSFVLLSRDRNVLGGVLLGLGLFKFQITLPIALLFLIWRRWRFLLGFSASAVVLVCLSVFLAGAAQTKLYVLSLMAIAGLSQPPSDLARYPITLGQMANLRGLLYGVGGGWMSATQLHLAAILVSAAVLTWTALRGFVIKPSSLLLLLAIPCAVLVGHHTYVHDLSVLIVPVLVVLNTFLPSELYGDSSERLISRVAVVMFVAPVVEAFSASNFFLITLAVVGLLLAMGAASTRRSFGAPESAADEPVIFAHDAG